MIYRRPSLKTMLGITKWKKRIKKRLGINFIMRPFRAPGNFKRRMLRRAGYYSEPMKMFRLFRRVWKQREREQEQRERKRGRRTRRSED